MVSSRFRGDLGNIFPESADPYPVKKLVLFGSNGGLGTAIAACAAARSNLDLCRISWSTASIWTEKEIAAWFESNIGGDEADVIFANGLTDPAMPRHDLMVSNFLFPQSVINATRRQTGLRYMTFGSVLEHRHDADSPNPYFASKIELSAYLQSLAAAESSRRFLHLRLHTLFGSAKPHAHMFIGQVLHSLRSNTVFEMSSGRQYRQYHHVDDIARAIVELLGSQWHTSPIVDINGEETFQLANLATAVFDQFGKSELLKIGALSTPAHDVLEAPNYPPSTQEFVPFARPTLPSLCGWLECLGARTTG